MTIFGEVHATEPVIALQKTVAAAMADALVGEGRLNIVMEHFSFEMQHLLDDYSSSRIDLQQLEEAYAAIGTEGHKVAKYEPLLELARNSPNKISLHGGFIPRTFAKIVMRESLDAALAASKEKGYLDEGEDCKGTDAHYNFFESLISGRDMHDKSLAVPDKFRRLFPAQVIKDAAMARKVRQLVVESKESDKFLVICGNGHMGYNHGVPERIFSSLPDLEASCVRVYCQVSNWLSRCSAEECVNELRIAFGSEGSNVADVCMVLEELSDEDSQVKGETAAAYNKVGQTAHLAGNMSKARKVLTRLGYSLEQIEVAGQDAYNAQGVGCPHKFALLKPGEAVLDVGSGLGIDSYIAADAVGPNGSVTGLDLSRSEVSHASARAKERGITNARFIVGDVERMPLPDESVDAVISNGAFCLVPNKPKALAEVMRVLKPGGRFAICTSTVKKDLEIGVNWPICMRMFIQLSELQPLCEKLGFEDVNVDLSDPDMQFDIDEGSEASSGQKSSDAEERARNHVHVGSKEFEHLRGYDMNSICARVTVTGTKASS